MAIALLLLLLICLLLHHGATVVDASSSWDARDFFTRCPPSRCSPDGPEIRFPLRLDSSSSPSSCGARETCASLACSGRDTVLLHPVLGPCNVTSIDYGRQTLNATLLSPACPTLQKLTPTSIPADAINSKNCDLYYFDTAKLVGCTTEWPFTPGSDEFVAGPISCSLSDADELTTQQPFSYLTDAHASITVLPLDCKVISRRSIPIISSGYVGRTFRQNVEQVLGSSEMVAYWGPVDETPLQYECQRCERDGQLCAFSSQRNRTFCAHRPRLGSHVKVIAATSSVATVVVLLSTVAIALYISLKKRYNEEIHLKVEMFLKTYGTSKPARYSFSEVKKIARRFKEEIGHGGSGSVYKGELPNGVPVAVKMLENTKGEGEDFINEVATIGRIHHANIVHLLGFCSEGTRHALVYEFMPNESLEKYIFSHVSNISRQLLAPNKLLDIALGIAQGMEYLHQGCNQRILHFDIKPHNILLDYNFNPKISDFGLAKLCRRDQSIVTLTEARGTMGYIAPELYSQNFGGVSYKSDVYSFGMLVLEMVSGRRNTDPSIESQNEVYLPEWIYEKILTGQELVISPGMEMAHEEKEKVRQLAIVGLWCIQWNPKNRPAATKVINMLTGILQNLQMPPKPFVTSENQPMP